MRVRIGAVAQQFSVCGVGVRVARENGGRGPRARDANAQNAATPSGLVNPTADAPRRNDAHVCDAPRGQRQPERAELAAPRAPQPPATAMGCARSMATRSGTWVRSTRCAIAATSNAAGIASATRRAFSRFLAARRALASRLRLPQLRPARHHAARLSDRRRDSRRSDAVSSATPAANAASTHGDPPRTRRANVPTSAATSARVASK